MRASDRDQRRPAIAALCAALVIITAVIPVSALNADYRVYSNGTAYLATVQVDDASHYDFTYTGALGEPVPFSAGNVQLTGNGCSNCSFNWSGNSKISFAEGNYSVSFVGPISDDHFQAVYESPYTVNLTLPQEFDVRNPLLAGISPGANVTRYADNTTMIFWDNVNAVDLRFYDSAHEQLLYLFGNFWIVIAIVLLVPYIITARKRD